MKFSTIIIVVLIFICGCKDRECIVESTNNINDSIVHMKKIDECNDSRIIEEQEFTKSKSGKLIAEGNAIYYNKNGLVDKRLFFTDGDLYGSQYYFQDGKIKMVDYYYHKSEKWLTIKFDANRNIISIDGKLLRITLTEKYPYFDSIPLNARLRLMEEVATIDGVRTILNVKVEHDGTKHFDTTISRFIPVVNTSMTGTECTFKNKGDYYFTAKVTLIDSTSGEKLYVDSFDEKIVVY